MQKIIAKKHISDKQAESLKGKFLDDNAYDIIITTDTDCYDSAGILLFKFRKNATLTIDT